VLTYFRVYIRCFHVAYVDLLPNPILARMLLSALKLLASRFCTVYFMYEVKKNCRSKTARESYKEASRWLEHTPPWSTGCMVDVKFEGLAKLSRYEWRKTVPVEHVPFYDEDREQAREMTYLQ
jgi:hypothetical protein